jgi:hypothetical protein
MLDFERSSCRATFRPFDDDELEGGAGAPEEGGHGQRHLAEAVAPEQEQAMIEFAQQIPGVLVQHAVVDAGIGDIAG